MTEETDSDVRFLDHGDVVGSVSDGEGHCVPAFLDLNMNKGGTVYQSAEQRCEAREGSRNVRVER